MSPLAIQGIFGIVQGMARITSTTPSTITNPVVAAYGDIELRCRARELRGDRTLADAARLVSLNRDELARIERGDTVQIRFDTLVKLMNGYGCELSDLLEVVTPDERQVGAPWLAPLTALRAGRVRPGVPSRREPDELVDEILPSGVGSDFAEDDSTDDRVRRSAFRPSARR